MEPKFEIGEVALYIGSYPTLSGTEVTVVSGPSVVESIDVRSGKLLPKELLYEIDSSAIAELKATLGLRRVVAFPRVLKKIPPKQDWMKLFRLNDIPKDILIAA
jgi:hypothetical protein